MANVYSRGGVIHTSRPPVSYPESQRGEIVPDRPGYNGDPFANQPAGKPNNGNPNLPLSLDPGAQGGDALTGRSQTISKEHYQYYYQQASPYLNDPNVPESLKSRLTAALYNIYNAQNDAARREAQVEFTNVLGDIYQKSESELAFERSRVGFQVTELTNAGMSRFAALQSVSGAQYSPGVAEANSASAPDAGSIVADNIGKTVQAVATTASTIYSLGTSAAMFGVQLKQLDAIANAAQVNTSLAQMGLQALDAANVFMAADYAVSKMPYYPGKRSFESIADAIVQGAQDGLPVCEQVIPLLSSGILTSKFGREIINGMINGNIDNHYYEDQKVLQLNLDKIAFDKISSEIGLNYASLDKLYLDIKSQDMSNIAQSLDLQVKQASFADYKAYQIQLWQDMFQAISAKDKDGVTFYYKRLLNDERARAYGSQLAYIYANASCAQLAELQKSNPELYSKIMLFGQPAVRECFSTMSTINDIMNSTVTQSSTFTLFGKASGYSSTRTGAYASELCDILGIDTPDSNLEQDVNEIVNIGKSLGNQLENPAPKPEDPGSGYTRHSKRPRRIK